MTSQSSPIRLSKQSFERTKDSIDIQEEDEEEEEFLDASENLSRPVSPTSFSVEELQENGKRFGRRSILVRD